MFKYTKALCRKIPRSIVAEGLRLEKEKTVIDYEEAVKSHESYIETLRKLGLHVTVLEADESLPDCVFVEDNAVVVNDTVLITCPGASSRRNEIKAIKEYFENNEKKIIIEMKYPACLDGGDVLFTGQEFFVGLSKRTNKQGFETLQKAFPNFLCHFVIVSDGLHLKSFLSMVCDDVIVCGKSKGASEALKQVLSKATYDYSVLRVGEDAGANVLFINECIVCRTEEEMPLANKEYKKLSYKKIQLSGRELAKVDGCLTCSSLLYN